MLNIKYLGIKRFGDCMANKPKEKLSDRLTKLFLSRVSKYDYLYFTSLTSIYGSCIDYAPIELAKAMSKIVMDMIAEYEPEDIE